MIRRNGRGPDGSAPSYEQPPTCMAAAGTAGTRCLRDSHSTILVSDVLLDTGIRRDRDVLLPHALGGRGVVAWNPVKHHIPRVAPCKLDLRVPKVLNPH